MQLKPEEISKVIRSQIKYYENRIQQNETGTVLMVGDGIARASGLVNCMAGELLEFEDGSFGMAQNLEENSVSIVLFGSDENIGEGQTVKRTGKVVSVPVGEAMIGRVVNALGQPIDGAGPIVTEEYRAIESPAPGICERKSVFEPFTVKFLYFIEIVIISICIQISQICLHFPNDSVRRIFRVVYSKVNLTGCNFSTKLCIYIFYPLILNNRDSSVFLALILSN